ncbi:MAG: hypothetical protein R3F56_18660 [Planctomycetota bacterium]
MTPPSWPQFSPAELEAAAARLRGHLVACPVVGDLCLPGFAPAETMRLKLELLQPGGSLWYRGAQHWLMRQFGRRKGLVLHGSPRQMAAWVAAARGQRMPVVARVGEGQETECRGLLGGFAVELLASERSPAAIAGYASTPDAADVDVALGVASLALELRDELPSDTRALVVCPALLAPAVAAGVAALGLTWQVDPAPPAHPEAARLARVLRDHHRIDADEHGGAAVAAGLGRDGVCVVLGE